MDLILVKYARGKKVIVDAGSRRQLNRRLKELRSSTRGGVSARRKKYDVRYAIEEQQQSPWWVPYPPAEEKAEG